MFKIHQIHINVISSTIFFYFINKQAIQILNIDLSKVCNTIVFDVVKTPKQLTFYQIRWGLDKHDFLFFKIYNFFTKKVTGGLFDYYCIVPKEETKIRRSSSQ